MKKVIIVIVILIMLVMVILNTSKNTSTTELLVSETKARNDIESIHGAIDVVGAGAFKGVEIKSKAFKGEIEQPASSATEHLLTYNIKDTIIMKYAGDSSKGGSITVDGGVDYVDLSIPSTTRKELLEAGSKTAIPMEALYDFKKPGLPPIVKDKTSATWVRTFLLSDTGMGLEKLVQNEEKDSPLSKLIKSIEDDAKVAADGANMKFMKFAFGDGTTLDWNKYKTDRIVAMKQINSDALTGLGKGSSIQNMTNPNLVGLYQVAHINTTNLNSVGTVTAGEIDIIGTKVPIADFNRLVTHINQTLGGKLVLIPNQDASVLTIDGTPTFVLN